jgi:hypothetical protein
MADAEQRVPGIELYHREPYGAKSHLREYGMGSNAFRTPRFAQPSVLKEGDILATGDMVLSPPREGGNGSVLLHLTGGTYGHWIGVPSRIPLALLCEDDEEYEELRARAIHERDEIRDNTYKL